MPNILITGGSGYLGGSLLDHLTREPELFIGSTFYALVRNDDQAALVGKHFKAKPLVLDLSDQATITKKFVELKISIVFFLIDAAGSTGQVKMINALSEVGKTTGLVTHLVHTSGAKGFSSLTGFPTDRHVGDDDPSLYSIMNGVAAPHLKLQGVVDANQTIINLGEARNVKTYIFAPCIVYGKGTGFGNKISIQTVAVVQAAKGVGRVYRVNDNDPEWPVCHVNDNTTLFVHLLKKMIAREDIPHGRNGYYLASPGPVKWNQIYSSFATALAKRGVVKDAEVHDANQDALKTMADALGCDPSFVEVQLGGQCTWTPCQGKAIGWQPKYAPEHLIETAAEEVDLILDYL